MKKCRYCAEEIQDEAVICKHCRRDLTKDPPEIIAQKRGELTKRLAELEGHLKNSERSLQEATKTADEAQRSLTVALLGILIGIPLLLFYGAGAICILAGILAGATQLARRDGADSIARRARAEIEEIQLEIVNTKTQLATLQ